MNDTRCTAFAGHRCIASGDLEAVALQTREILDGGEQSTVLIFDDASGRIVDVDFRGTADDLRSRLQPPDEKRGPGRPRLGVVAREVTLLPRHWEWLNEQPGGASVALRKLVDEARKANEGRDRVRRSQAAANRFMTAMAGDLAGYEEATRALFAGNREGFERNVASWPDDVRAHATRLAGPAISEPGAPTATPL